jgi:hypothetical protein
MQARIASEGIRLADPASPQQTGKGAWHCMSVPELLGGGLAAGDEVEDRGAEVGQPLLADALAPQEGGG